MPKLLIYSLLSGLVLFLTCSLGFGLGYLVGLDKDSDIVIDTYQKCVDAGGIILESYPQQCSLNGKTFTDPSQQQIEPGDPLPTSPTPGREPANSLTKLPDAYGWSNNSNCSASSECLVGGCNSEICGAKSDELVSNCIFPTDQPLPPAAGYNCGCNANQCSWSK